MRHELRWVNREAIAGITSGYNAVCECGRFTRLCGTVEEAKSEHQRHAYIKNLQSAVLHAFGYEPDEDDCLGWWEVDATIDQAVGWIDHGCGPGDYAGSPVKDPEEAWS